MKLDFFQEMAPSETSDSITQLKFVIPTRGLIGLRSTLLTATKGTVVMDSQVSNAKIISAAALYVLP
jgi:predicted membrane GTPase involved in stress response